MQAAQTEYPDMTDMMTARGRSEQAQAARTTRSLSTESKASHQANQIAHRPFDQSNHLARSNIKRIRDQIEQRVDSGKRLILCEPMLCEHSITAALAQDRSVDEAFINCLDAGQFSYLAVALGKTAANRRDLNWLSNQILGGPSETHRPTESEQAQEDASEAMLAPAHEGWSTKERAAAFFESHLLGLSVGANAADESRARQEAANNLEQIYLCRKRVSGVGFTCVPEFLPSVLARAQARSAAIAFHVQAKDALSHPGEFERLLSLTFKVAKLCAKLPQEALPHDAGRTQTGVPRLSRKSSSITLPNGASLKNTGPMFISIVARSAAELEHVQQRAQAMAQATRVTLLAVPHSDAATSSQTSSPGVLAKCWSVG